MEKNQESLPDFWLDQVENACLLGAVYKDEQREKEVGKCISEQHWWVLNLREWMRSPRCRVEIKKTKGIFWSTDICEKICYIENHSRNKLQPVKWNDFFFFLYYTVSILKLNHVSASPT